MILNKFGKKIYRRKCNCGHVYFFEEQDMKKVANNLYFTICSRCGKRNYDRFHYWDLAFSIFLLISTLALIYLCVLKLN